MSRHTYDYGVIGNCGFTAHIHKDTNVSWMCMPRFDSSFLFGSMLDTKKGGEFAIQTDRDRFHTRQYYIENTNVLCTEVESHDCKFRVTDCAPRFEQYDRYFRPMMLIRKVEPLEGSPRIKVNCRPVYEYGKRELKKTMGSNHIRYLGLDTEVRLTTNFSLNYIMEDEYFILNETKYLVFTYGPPLEAPVPATCETFINQTINYWRKWVKSTSISNMYQQQMIRSALALKIHQFEDTGAIIASCTTSLPESDGSTRNWDYRFCWMRDTFYTLNAFNSIGHFEELEQYFNYILNITYLATDRMQPLYGITGEQKLTETTLELEGYLGRNKPVRVGNDAYTHIQNDVYGQVLVSLLPLFVDNRFNVRERIESASIVNKMLDLIELTIDEPDAGLWEFRNMKQYHCYTSLFHWAGACAAIKVAKEMGDHNMGQKAVNLRDKARFKIEACYVPGKKGYGQAEGVDRMDASTLQLLMMNYLDGNSDAAKNHLRALERELKASDGLFYRYRHKDDFGEPETTFLICGFWYVEALTCVNRIDEAMGILENLMGYANHVGLLSEDVSEKDGGMWGNFPQAYSHVGLINAVKRIGRKLDRPNFL